jgi:hypothetical protein
MQFGGAERPFQCGIFQVSLDMCTRHPGRNVALILPHITEAVMSRREVIVGCLES